MTLVPGTKLGFQISDIHVLFVNLSPVANSQHHDIFVH
jgi:hypothetical protein